MSPGAGPDSGALVLSVDLGSSFVKAALVDSKLKIRALSRIACPPRRLGQGRVEVDGLKILRAADRAVQNLPSAALHRAQGLALSSQRSTSLIWDPRKGRPLEPGLSWQDSRCAEQVRAMEGRRAEVEEKTGLRLSPYYAGPKFAYLLDQVSSRRRGAARGRILAGTLSSFVLWHWLGGARVQDQGNGQRTLLMNLDRLAWDPALLRLFRVPRASLGRLIPSQGRLGLVRRWGLRLPLLSVLGDQQAAALASPGEIINYGTGAFVLSPTGSRRPRKKGLLCTLLRSRQAASGRPLQRELVLEGSVQDAGSLFDWARSLGLGRISPARLPAGPGGKQAVFCLAGPGGLASPRWVPDLPPALPGLRADSPRRKVFRALSSALAFGVQDILDAARSKGGERKTLFASGSLSASASLLRFQAGLSGRNLVRLEEKEASLIGAARSAWEETGDPEIRDRRWRDSDKPKSTKIFRPGSPARVRVLRAEHKAWGRELDRLIVRHRRLRPEGKRTWPELGPRPLVIGHRGYRARFPENTLSGFRAAFRSGAGMVECDVQLSRDQVPVILHDLTLDRTTNGRGSPSRKTWSELGKLDAGSWFDPRFAGQGLPRLEDLLDLLPPHKLVYVEIKSETEGLDGLRRPALGDEALFKLVDRAADLIEARGLENRSLIASFDPRVFRYAKLARPRLRTGLIFEDMKVLEASRSLDFRYLDVLCPRWDLVNKSFMKKARGEGFLVFSWTAKTAKEFTRLSGLGVDGIVMDEVRLGS